MEEMEKIREVVEKEKNILQKDYENSLTPIENVEENIEENKNTNLVETLMNTDSAITIAKKQYEEIGNQTKIAKKMGNVVNRATKAEIDVAEANVFEKEVNTKIKKQEQKNKIMQLKNDRKFISREQKHRLLIQKFEHRKQKYYDLLLRYCRKKQKNEKGEYEFLVDKDNNPIINMPNGFVLAILIFLDATISTLNLSSEIISSTNKVVFKSIFIILILCLLFIPPLRNWLLGLIGIKF